MRNSFSLEFSSTAATVLGSGHGPMRAVPVIVPAKNPRPIRRGLFRAMRMIPGPMNRKSVMLEAYPASARPGLVNPDPVAPRANASASVRGVAAIGQPTLIRSNNRVSVWAPATNPRTSAVGWAVFMNRPNCPMDWSFQGARICRPE